MISYGYGAPNRCARSTFCRYGVSGRIGHPSDRALSHRDSAPAQAG